MLKKIDFIGHFFYLSFDAAHRKHWCNKLKSLVLQIKIIGAAHRKHWCSKPRSSMLQTDPLIKPILKSIDCVIL